MKINIGKIKDSADAIFLLILLIVGLLLAQGLISFRNRVYISKPIKFDDDLSLSVPTGDNWTKPLPIKWENNGLKIINTRMVIRQEIKTIYQCIYKPFNNEITSEEKLENLLPDDSEIADSGLVSLEFGQIQWVFAESPNNTKCHYIGLFRMTNNRILEIQVTSSDSHLARRIFMASAHSIIYKPTFTTDSKEVTLLIN